MYLPCTMLTTWPLAAITFKLYMKLKWWWGYLASQVDFCIIKDFPLIEPGKYLHEHGIKIFVERWMFVAELLGLIEDGLLQIVLLTTLLFLHSFGPVSPSVFIIWFLTILIFFINLFSYHLINRLYPLMLLCQWQPLFQIGCSGLWLSTLRYSTA